MIKGLMHPHVLFVSLFLLIYLIKTILLLSDKDELLEKFKKKTRIAEMIISFGFLVTGIILLILIPSALNTYMIIKLVLVFASSGAKDLSVTQLSHAGIVEIITNGKTPMAAYKDALTAEQIEAVASYIETDLKGK